MIKRCLHLRVAVILIDRDLSSMEKYQILKKLGSGSFGNVEMAEDKKTKEVVAIKQLKKKYGTWE